MLHLQASLPRTTDKTAPPVVEPKNINLNDRDPNYLNDIVKIYSPLVRCCTIAIKPISALWKLLVVSFIDPLFESIGKLFSSIIMNFKRE
ncbi:hypothetical protein KUTeg_021266 [Tegillarca granosa]|uniref:Caveolin n=1 Tax=Tegillarca granosa TaxID=220873 RepID=A0ABQ9ECL1_TEGGR|nr:hypothetical protein KUTeg_021266 [Tegillarca granosa]